MNPETVTRPGYSFYLVNISCLPNSEHFNVIMDLEESVEEVLPYLASILPGCTYTHGTGVINHMDTGHIVGIYPRRITITDVVGTDEAERLCREYMDRINHVVRHRDEIDPVYQKRPTLTVLDILRSLPKTNCGLCGVPTCMAFAAKVFRREEAIGSCEPLVREQDRCRDLFLQLQANGYPIP